MIVALSGEFEVENEFREGGFADERLLRHLLSYA